MAGIQNEAVRVWRHSLTFIKIEITAISMQYNVSKWTRFISAIQSNDNLLFSSAKTNYNVVN